MATKPTPPAAALRLPAITLERVAALMQLSVTDRASMEAVMRKHGYKSVDTVPAHRREALKTELLNRMESYVLPDVFES